MPKVISNMSWAKLLTLLSIFALVTGGIGKALYHIADFGVPASAGELTRVETQQKHHITKANDTTTFLKSDIRRQQTVVNGLLPRLFTLEKEMAVEQNIGKNIIENQKEMKNNFDAFAREQRGVNRQILRALQNR